MRNAEDYRRKWQQQLISNVATSNRCPDCPLERPDDSTACEIHARWLDLLNRYVTGETSSRAYVGDTLALLRRNKERLKQCKGKTAGKLIAIVAWVCCPIPLARTTDSDDWVT